MDDLLQKHEEDTHFFCDETPIGGRRGLSQSFLIGLSKKISPLSFFWLACDKESRKNDQHQDGEAIS